jgi:hypothetical protein
MGLMARALDKAQTTDTEGLLKRAMELHGDAVAKPLLPPKTPAPPKKKAFEPASEPIVQPQSAIRAILHDLPALPESLELPAHLFRLLVENLDLSRSAILLPDYDEDVFVPWAAHGLDATSLHRLRIPTADLRVVLAGNEAGVMWVGDSCREFAPYFSRREASILEQLLVFPFADQDDLQAVLIVAESSYFGVHTEFLRIILAAVGEPAASTMQQQRLAGAPFMRQSIVFKPIEVDTVAERISAHSPGGTRLVLLQLSDIISQVATANDFLDPFRVRQDVLRVLAGVFASTASVCDVDEHRALLLLHGATEEDLELLVQHASATLAHYFPEISDVPVLRFTSRRHPDDGDDLAALVRSLL